jgi:hypothetical protein
MMHGTGVLIALEHELSGAMGAARMKELRASLQALSRALDDEAR